MVRQAYRVWCPAAGIQERIAAELTATGPENAAVEWMNTAFWDLGLESLDWPLAVVVDGEQYEVERDSEMVVTFTAYER